MEKVFAGPIRAKDKFDLSHITDTTANGDKSNQLKYNEDEYDCEYIKKNIYKKKLVIKV